MSSPTIDISAGETLVRGTITDNSANFLTAFGTGSALVIGMHLIRRLRGAI